MGKCELCGKEGSGMEADHKDFLARYATTIGINMEGIC